PWSCSTPSAPRCCGFFKIISRLLLPQRRRKSKSWRRRRSESLRWNRHGGSRRMTADKTTSSLKTRLQRECLPALAAQTAYFSQVDIRAWLDEHGLSWRPGLLNEYMSQFMQTGVVYDAGRGWYS